ncbi:MAG: dihydrofolate reductase family protein [Sneathiellales bacterium]|nr:dihydrofolate reductase family protein [Sneathiellales bacterium]
MRKLALLTFQTLNGVMQAPSMPEEDYSGNFREGGWAMPYWEEVMEQVRLHAMKEPYDLLLGRKTYELFAPHWTNPENDGPEAEKFRSARKYVVTDSLKGFSWENSHALSPKTLAEEISGLKQGHGPLLQVHGSWQLIQALLHHDLVDEIRLWTFPVLVGPGKRLFENPSQPSRFSLMKSEQTSGGALMTLYRKA